MNILFLHGLESKLSKEKKEILDIHGNLFVPDMDYYSNPNIIQWLIDEYKAKKIDVVIGSSMGGFAGYYLTKTIPCTALLFNPALPYRTTLQNIPEAISIHKKPITLVLGIKDEIIKSSDTLLFVAENPLTETNCIIHLRNDLEHRITMEIFEEEVNKFFLQLK